MAANVDNLWEVPAYLPYLQPSLTDRAVKEAEAAIGYTLPRELVELLKKQNGGYIRFSLSDLPHDSIAGIGPHYPSLTEFDWEDVQEHVEFPLQGLVPLDGDGHWHLCLDYRENDDNPTIAYVDVECNSQRQIAASFSEYLDLLTLEDRGELVVDAEDLPKLLSQVAEALGVTFGPPDLWAHGYPTYRAALGTKADPQWLWISPNRVIRGFVRENDKRYAELKHLLPGYGFRFPELGENSFLVSTTEEVREKVIDGFAKCGMELRPLLHVIKDS